MSWSHDAPAPQPPDRRPQRLMMAEQYWRQPVEPHRPTVLPHPGRDPLLDRIETDVREIRRLAAYASALFADILVAAAEVGARATPHPTADLKVVLPLAEAADRLSIAVPTLRRLIRAGHVDPVQIGRGLYVATADLPAIAERLKPRNHGGRR